MILTFLCFIFFLPAANALTQSSAFSIKAAVLSDDGWLDVQFEGPIDAKTGACPYYIDQMTYDRNHTRLDVYVSESACHKKSVAARGEWMWQVPPDAMEHGAVDVWINGSQTDSVAFR